MPHQTRRAGHIPQLVQELGRKGWYHSLQLPDGRVIEGIISLDQLRSRFNRLGVPEDLRGKRALDIGAWDGWFSFEMEKRGAEVVAVDCADVENFRYARKLLGSKVDYRILDVLELSPDELGRFDVVLFLGVLYHLKHPLLGLETVCRLTRDIAIVESFVTEQEAGAIPALEFYETDELGGQLDNWFGPTVECLLALCRTAGFARVALQYVDESRACVKCWRQWEPEPQQPAHAPPSLANAYHSRNNGINFETAKDEYLTCEFATDEPGLDREKMRVQVGEFGARAVWLGQQGPGRWQANCKLPPGLDAGWQEVKVRTEGSRFSNAVKIAVDLPVTAGSIAVFDLCDGLTWERGNVTSGYITLWIRGLTELADRNNIHVVLGGTRLPVEFVGATDEKDQRQVNARVTRTVEGGEHTLVVRYGGAQSPPLRVRVEPLP
jgi:tRNA (mo5U34)-methyltransferase